MTEGEKLRLGIEKAFADAEEYLRDLEALIKEIAELRASVEARSARLDEMIAEMEAAGYPATPRG